MDTDAKLAMEQSLQTHHTTIGNKNKCSQSIWLIYSSSLLAFTDNWVVRAVVKSPTCLKYFTEAVRIPLVSLMKL